MFFDEKLLGEEEREEFVTSSAICAPLSTTQIHDRRLRLLRKLSQGLAPDAVAVREEMVESYQSVSEAEADLKIVLTMLAQTADAANQRVEVQLVKARFHSLVQATMTRVQATINTSDFKTLAILAKDLMEKQLRIEGLDMAAPIQVNDNRSVTVNNIGASSAYSSFVEDPHHGNTEDLSIVAAEYNVLAEESVPPQHGVVVHRPTEAD